MDRTRIIGAGLLTILSFPLFGYIASSIFLWRFGGDPESASLTSYFYLVRDYWGTDTYRPTLLAGFLVPMGLIVTLVIGLIIRQWYKRPLYGNRHFATEAEIKAAGLRNYGGVVLGKANGAYLIPSGQFAVTVIGPPRSGKGAGIAIPSLLGWPGSALVLDIKSELHEITSKYRMDNGQDVYQFAPLSRTSHRFNPLDKVPHRGANRIDELQLVTNTLIPNPKGSNPLWASGARSLLSAVTLYLMDTGGIVTLGEANRVIRRSSDLGKFFQAELDPQKGPVLSDDCAHEMRAYISKAPKEQSGVLSTLRTSLELWANPLVDHATSATDFQVSDMRRNKMTIYIGIEPNDMNRLAPLISLFMQQSLGSLLGALPGPDERYQILALLDEMHAFGKIQKLVDGMAYMASYNIVPLLMVQDMRQLRDVYGDAMAEVFLSSSKYRVFLSVNDSATAKYVSDHLGDTTIHAKHVSRPAFSRNPFDKTVSVHQTAKALMSASEILDMSEKKQIILVESHQPILADKIRYFEDKTFSSRAA